MDYNRARVKLLQRGRVLAAATATLSLVTAAAFAAVTPHAAAQPTSTTKVGSRQMARGSGTPNFLARWATTTTLGNSTVFQSGSGASSRIGLNGTTPAAALDVVAPDQSGLYVEGPQSGVGSGLDLRTTGSGSHQWELLATGASAQQGASKLNLRDVNAGADRLTINASGQVGIGNTNPGAALDVTAPNQSGIFVKSPVSGVGAGLDFFTTGSGGTQWEVLATGNSASQGTGNFNIRDVTSGTNYFTIFPKVETLVNGDLGVVGLLFTDGSCKSGCAPTKKVRYFVPRAAAPVAEDYGTAQLVDGRATVRIDPAFAAGTDQSRPYLVFLTPQGDSEGLYVARKGPSGFSVAEMRGGRHTFAFDYHIVAGDAEGNGRRVAIVDRTPRR